MNNSRCSSIDFGRHQGRLLPHLLFTDPDYFFWACEADVFRGMLAVEATRVHRRATSIRIPTRHGTETVVEYTVGPSGRFEGLNLCPATMTCERGGSSSFTKRVIDMSVPRAMHNYDKGGGKILVRDVKLIVFGDANLRMTSKRAGEFFADDANFVLELAS